MEDKFIYTYIYKLIYTIHKCIYIQIYSRGGARSALLDKHSVYLFLFLLEPSGRDQFGNLFSVLLSRHPLGCRGKYTIEELLKTIVLYFFRRISDNATLLKFQPPELE